MPSPCPLHSKKIAFVTCGYSLDVSTMLINSIALLSEHNQVDVIVSPFDSRHALCPAWMQPLFLHAPKLDKGLFYRGLRRLCRIMGKRLPNWCAGPAWWLKNFDTWNFIRWLRRHLRAQSYDLVMAVECTALIAVAKAEKNCNILYYNMELLDWSPVHPLYTDKIYLKKMEMAALSSVTHVLITSPNRAQIFSKINDYPLKKISVLPVVPRKVAFTAKSSFFRDMFAIPEDKYIVIYSGNFMPWAQCLEIIESMDIWPAEAVLVMHTWNEQTLRSKYFQQMQVAAQGRPVYFSSRYLPYAGLAHALSSADVGLLYYEAIDANFTEIMFSSNKFGEYMAAGLPVICSPFPSLAEFVEAQNIGRAISIENIGPALRDIIGNLEAYRMHVSLCREKYFDFDRYFATAFDQYIVQKHRGYGVCG